MYKRIKLYVLVNSEEVSLESEFNFILVSSPLLSPTLGIGLSRLVIVKVNSIEPISRLLGYSQDNQRKWERKISKHLWTCSFCLIVI